MHNLTYIDDSIFIAAPKAECEESVRKFKALCKDWNIILKEEKDAVSTQKMIAFGIEYDLTEMTKRTADKRRDDTKADLVAACTTNNKRHWENLVGVLWFVSPCIRAAKPHTYLHTPHVGGLGGASSNENRAARSIWRRSRSWSSPTPWALRGQTQMSSCDWTA